MKTLFLDVMLNDMICLHVEIQVLSIVPNGT